MNGREELYATVSYKIIQRKKKTKVSQRKGISLMRAAMATNLTI